MVGLVLLDGQKLLELPELPASDTHMIIGLPMNLLLMEL
jgi:hypothetical protein